MTFPLFFLGEPGTIDASKPTTRIQGTPKLLPVRSHCPDPRARRFDTSPMSPANWYLQLCPATSKSAGSCSVMLGRRPRVMQDCFVLWRGVACSSHSGHNCGYIRIPTTSWDKREKQIETRAKEFLRGARQLNSDR